MTKLNDGFVEIEVNQQGSEFFVKLTGNQYHRGSIQEYKLFLQPNHLLLNGDVVVANDEQLEIKYDIPATAKSITATIKGLKLLNRVEIARKFSSLQQNEINVAQMFIHPDNLFLISNQLYVAHRGMRGSIDPKCSDCATFFQQYRALVLNVLLPKYRFEELLTTKIKLKNKEFNSIGQATTVAEIEMWLDQKYDTLQRSANQHQRQVKKSQYQLFKFLVGTFGVLVLGLGIWLGLLLENTIPRQSRIIAAQSAFVVNNFAETVTILAQDEPRTLPTMVQYILATSHIELSGLSANQRQVLLNNLSPSSHENDLLYWIYSGRGELLIALDIAYSLGDNQLKLHAYALRYDYIDADMQIPGAVKQEYLARYRRRMEELIAILEGREAPIAETGEGADADD